MIDLLTDVVVRPITDAAIVCVGFGFEPAGGGCPSGLFDAQW